MVQKLPEQNKHIVDVSLQETTTMTLVLSTFMSLKLVRRGFLKLPRLLVENEHHNMLRQRRSCDSIVVLGIMLTTCT